MTRSAPAALRSWIVVPDPLFRFVMVVGVVSAVGFILLPATPTLHPVPYRDSGVFLYVGQRILDGDMPYRDVWDHKPPGIHIVNAIALAVADGSMWGVWSMQFAAVLAAALIGWFALGSAATRSATACATVVWLCGLPFVLQHGNTTEGFALPLQMGAIWLFLAGRRSSDARHRLFALAGIGAVGAALALLKPNLLGLPLAAALLLLAERSVDGEYRSLGADVLALAAGGSGLVLPIVAWLTRSSALNAFFDAVWRYNLAYSDTTWSDRLVAAGNGLGLLAPSSTTWLAGLGWVAAVMILIRPPSSGLPTGLRSLAMLAAFAAPAEVALGALAGRDYPHYFTAWLPVSAVCVAVLVAAVRWSSPSPLGGVQVAFRIVIIAGVALGAVAAAREIYHQLLTPSPDIRVQQAAEYLARRTSPADTVLVWGAETAVNFLCERAAPTRFVYQYPLYTSGYTRDELLKEFAADLRRNPPLFVLDTSSSNIIIPSLDDRAMTPSETAETVYTVAPAIHEIRSWITANYVAVDTIGGWSVFRLRQSPTKSTGRDDRDSRSRLEP